MVCPSVSSQVAEISNSYPVFLHEEAAPTVQYVPLNYYKIFQDPSRMEGCLSIFTTNATNSSSERHFQIV